tara:strand:+ start:14310 stop:15164 length:855 start_codon:yes stop_codon:yes gene_type:complete
MFIPKDIEESLQLYDKSYYHENDNKLEFLVLTADEEIKDLKQQIHLLLKQIRKITDILPIPFTHLTIVYYPTDYKKTFPTKNTMFDLHNVQSGYTTHNGNNTVEIIIFRFEEAPKVLTHELLHSFGIHCLHSSSFKQNIEFRCTGLTMTKNQLYDEALVETWATLLTFDDINKQIKFSIKQAAKILRHLDFETFDQFWYPDTEKEYKLTTYPAIFPYYILKSAFLYNTDLFKKTFPLGSSKECNIYTKDDILLFITKKWKNKIDKYMVDIKLCSKEDNTMRMTN